MLELTHKDFKVTVISIFKDLKKNVIIMSGWMGNLNKAMETKSAKRKSQNGKVKYLKLKFNWRRLTSNWRLKNKG